MTYKFHYRMKIEYNIHKHFSTLRFHIILLVLISFITGCSRPSRTININDRLTQASKEHNEKLESNLTGNQSSRRIKKSSQTGSRITEGHENAPFTKELPNDNTYYYGLGFVDNCQNMNSCREQGETKARNDLSERISVTIKSFESLEVVCRKTGETENCIKEYKKTINERAVRRELQEVSFVHHYYIPEKQLQTLAKLPKQDLLERALEEISANIIKKLKQPVIVGFFKLKGEGRESLLSFFSGQFINEKLINYGHKDTIFMPKKIEETRKDYFNRMQKEGKPVLWGEYIKYNKFKLTVFLKQKSKNIRLESIEIPPTDLTRLLLNTPIITIFNPNAISKKFMFIYLQNPNNRLINSEDIVSTCRGDLEEAFQNKNLKVLNPGMLQKLKKNQHDNLQTKIKNTLLHYKDKDLLAVVFSLDGSIALFKGFLYKGLVSIDFKISVIRPNGSLLLVDRFNAKRYMSDDPTNLDNKNIILYYSKTIRKGLNESIDNFLERLLEAIAKNH
jgi:hypothetical protein